MILNLPWSVTINNYFVPFSLILPRIDIRRPGMTNGLNLNPWSKYKKWNFSIRLCVLCKYGHMTKKSKKKTFVKSTSKGLKSIGQCANFIIGCENRFIWFILELFVRPLGILRVTSDCSYTKLTRVVKRAQNPIVLFAKLRKPQFHKF